jgi:hypothetical protein
MAGPLQAPDDEELVFTKDLDSWTKSPARRRRVLRGAQLGGVYDLADTQLTGNLARDGQCIAHHSVE